ncbi:MULTISPECIES: hypothetical protein [unclassified Rhizobium]|uniref:hypothetical protein n=1 Tax=unclassified Rhizobium TaxID=2613769 RepID=UPI001FFE2128|nr:MULTISPECIES: hypothetical protein [unclassified Rhizobium]
MTTIGDLEKRAGIGASREDRTAFWLRFRHLDGISCLKAGVAELERLIAIREAENPSARTAEKPVRRTTLPPLTDEQQRALQAYICWRGCR